MNKFAECLNVLVIKGLTVSCFLPDDKKTFKYFFCWEIMPVVQVDETVITSLTNMGIFTAGCDACCSVKPF